MYIQCFLVVVEFYCIWSCHFIYGSIKFVVRILLTTHNLSFASVAWMCRTRCNQSVNQNRSHWTSDSWALRASRPQPSHCLVVLFLVYFYKYSKSGLFTVNKKRGSRPWMCWRSCSKSFAEPVPSNTRICLSPFFSDCISECQHLWVTIHSSASSSNCRIHRMHIMSY